MTEYKDQYIVTDLASVVNKTSTTRTDVRSLTNVTDQAQTWGTDIPNTAGQIRVEGAQVWVSGFVQKTVYQTDTTVTTEQYSIVGETYKNSKIFASTNPETHTGAVVTTTNDAITSQVTAYSVAFSFGYNIMPEALRSINRMWVDGKLVYDPANSIGLDLQIEFHPNGGQSDLMIANLGEDKAPYFPNETYLVLGNYPLANGAKPIEKLSAEFIVSSGIQSTFVIEKEYFQNDDAFGKTWFDWESRIAYCHILPKGIGYGELISYSLDTFDTISRKPIRVRDGGTVPKEFNLSDDYLAIYLSGCGCIVKSNANDYYSDPPYIEMSTLNVYTATIEAVARIRMSNRIDDQAPHNAGVVVENTNGAGSVWAKSVTSGNGALAKVSDGGRTLTLTNLNSPLNTNGQNIVYAYDNKGYAFFFSNYNDDTKGLYQIKENGIIRITNKFPPRIPYVNEMFIRGGVIYYINGDNERVTAVTFSGDTLFSATFSGYFQGGAFHGSDSELDGGTFGFATGGKLRVLYMSNGSIKDFGISIYNGAGAVAWDSYSGHLVNAPIGRGFDRSWRTLTPSISTGQGIKLSDFIKSLYAYSSAHSADKLQFNDINEEVLGGFVQGVQPVKDIVDNICNLFRIEKKTDLTGNTIFYRNKLLDGSITPVLRLDTDDVCFVDNSEDSRTRMQVSRSQPTNVPDIVTLKFIDPDEDYATNSVTWTRPDTSLTTNTSASFSVPLVLTKEQALALVQNVYNDIDARTLTYKLLLPPEFCMLESGDIITIESGPYIEEIINTNIGDPYNSFSSSSSSSRLVRRQFADVVQIIEDTHNADDSLSIECTGVGAGASLSLVLPTVPPVNVGGVGVSKGGAAYAVIDSVLVNEGDDTGDFSRYVQYECVYPRNPEGYVGGYLARRFSGVDWLKLFNEAAAPDLVVFRAGATLADLSHCTDDTLLPLGAVYGTYNSAFNTDRATLLADPTRNLAFYGRDGAWELIQFAQIVDGVMSTIIRSKNGSDAFSGNHLGGDMIFLITPKLFKEVRLVADIKGEQYKAASLNQAFSTLTADSSRTPSANSIKPWAPSNIKGKRNQSGDMTISWSRRDKFKRYWAKPLTDRVTTELVESYEVDIYKSNGDVARKLVSGVPNVTYTAAMQSADGNDTLASVGLAVYQMGSVVGRGLTRKVEIYVG